MSKSDLLKEQVIAYLGRKPKGEKVSSRNAIAMRYQVSRSTVDKVMRELESEGLIYSVKGSGTFVNVGPNVIPVETKETSKFMWAILEGDEEDDIMHPHYSGVKEFCDTHNCRYFVCKTSDDPDVEREYIKWLTRSGINGLIIVPARSDAGAVEWYRELQKMGIPFVFWNRSYDYMPEVPQVCLNGYSGAVMGTQYLLNKGYKKIAFLAPYRFRSSMDRFFGYCSALSEHGIELDMNMVDLETGLKDEEMQRAIDALLKRVPDVEAILCHSEEIGRAYLHYIALHPELDKVPEAVPFESVVERTEEMAGLTRISLNSYISGKQVGECLYKLCLGRPGDVRKLYVIEPRLVYGDK